MKLNDIWSVDKDGNGFSLCETVKTIKKDGSEGEKINKYFYGTFYQALNGFVIKASSNEEELEDVKPKVEEILSIIEDLKISVDDAFRIVKVVK